MAEAGARPQYVPTKDEITDAISVALMGSETTPPTAKEMQRMLESENPTWKLPERRVGKYLRRYLKQQGKTNSVAFEGGGDEDEESVSSQTSFARKAAMATRKSFSRLNKNRGSAAANDSDTAKTSKADDSSVSSQASLAKKARQGLTKLISKKNVGGEGGVGGDKKKRRGLSFRRKNKKEEEPEVAAAPPVIVTAPPAEELESEPANLLSPTNLLSPVTTEGDLEEEEQLLPDIETEQEPQLELEPEPQLELKPEPQLELKPEPQLELKSEPQLELEPEPQLELEPEPQLELEPEPAAVETAEVARDITYEDDNDGKKAEGLCTGCVIL